VVSLLLLLMLDPRVKLRLAEVMCSSYTAQFFCMTRPMLTAFDRLNVQLFNNPTLIARMDAQVFLSPQVLPFLGCWEGGKEGMGGTSPPAWTTTASMDNNVFSTFQPLLRAGFYTTGNCQFR
jgi:hypothetical protein